MEERRTAAVVLSIIAFIVLFFTVLLPWFRSLGPRKLLFASCRVQYEYYNKNVKGDIDRAENNKLALCLCRLYSKKPDTAIANHIIGIYRRFDRQTQKDSLIYDKSFDSLITNKKAVFDTVVTID